MSIINRNEEKDIIRQMKVSAKTHATLQEKKFVPLYAEYIHFLVKRAGLLVTKIYQHFTFVQSKYKKDFVITNQKSKQKAITDVEKDFYKLLNISNFGIDYRSNLDSRTLEPIYDELGEIAFIKKYDDIFDSGNCYQFADPDIMRKEINEKVGRLNLILNKNDPCYEAQKESYELQRESNLDAVNSMKTEENEQGKKGVFIKLRIKLTMLLNLKQQK